MKVLGPAVAAPAPVAAPKPVPAIALAPSVGSRTQVVRSFPGPVAGPLARLACAPGALLDLWGTLDDEKV